ncbi:hypothetical protein L2E82_42566 [Cichorium intybus]|uniref:Uncharacterized protein n=1 Tax=Cichorium intybus TaxID=13427 RepID=A0ACB8ZN58_CICIN|nr:hypothetical protein L2E82_42566 [Cichorium intybus]
MNNSISKLTIPEHGGEGRVAVAENGVGRDDIGNGGSRCGVPNGGSCGGVENGVVAESGQRNRTIRTVDISFFNGMLRNDHFSM